MTDIKRIQGLTGTTLDINYILNSMSEEIIKPKHLTAYDTDPWPRISTGCQNIDKILNGGVPINGLNELYGCSGVGKTQFCLQLSLQIQLPNQFGGLRKEVVYITTEDIFPSKRLKQLADTYRNKYNIDIHFEDHIYLEHIVDSGKLQECLLKRLPCFLCTKNVGLIIIDSIAGIYRSESDNPNYVARSQDFNVICKSLNSLQDKYNCGILIVNQVTDNLASGISEPCLGLAWANNITSRFALNRHRTGTKRQFEVVFAPDLPAETFEILITPEGLTSV